MKHALLLALSCLAASAAITGLRQVDATSTQVHVAYTAPSASVCTFELSESATYSPLVYDVDTSLFANSNRDDRTGSITSGTSRQIVLGTPDVETALDGSNLSRALKADTAHYLRVTCGSDTATLTVTTNTVPIGITRADAQQLSSFGVYKFPSNNPLKFPTSIDPTTGVAAHWSSASLGWTFGQTTLTTYSAATGTNWSPTTSTLIVSTQVDDTNYATHTAASQDWLYLALGLNKFPTNSSFSTVLSLQNIKIKGLCVAGGADCTGNDSKIDVALTRDGVTPLQPIYTVTLPTTEGSVTICGDGMDPCAAPDTPGDVMTYDIPNDQNSFGANPHWKVSDNTIFTGTGLGCNASNTIWCFNSSADCTRLWPGEDLHFHDVNYGDGGVTIASLSCGSTPPQITTGGGYDLTTPIPFAYLNGVDGNPRWGVMIRKHVAVANTMKLNLVQWRAVSSLDTSLWWGSGGFGKACTILADANGFYHCEVGSSDIIGYKPSTGEIRFLGMAHYNGATISSDLVSGTVYGSSACSGPSDFLWSDTDANKFYCSFQTTYPNPQMGGTVDNRVAIVEMTYTGNDVAQTPDINNPETWPQFAATGTIVTPCTPSACTSAAGDMTPWAQTRRFSSEFTTDSPDFTHDGPVAVQNDTIIWRVHNAQQDSYAWYFALDKSISPGTQQISSGFATYRSPYFRFCGDHTPQSPQGPNNGFFVVESGDKCKLQVVSSSTFTACNKFSQACSTCPSITVDGVNYTGKGWCSTLDFTSSWNGAWGSTPAGFATGDPVNPTLDTSSCNLRWVGNLAVGDFLGFTNGGVTEVVKLIQKNSATEYVVERGLGTTDNITTTLSPSDTIFTVCNCIDPKTTADPTVNGSQAGISWFYPTDTDGSLTYPDRFQNHGFHQSGYGVHPQYSFRSMDFSSRSDVQNIEAAVSTVFNAHTFASQSTNCQGNGCESHPGATNLTAPTTGNDKWFNDVNPFAFDQTDTPAWTNVTGDIYRWIGTNNLPYRVLDIQAIRGFDPLVNISGPSSDIDSAADGTLCIAVIAGECHAGSTAGQIFFKVQAIGDDLTCRQAEFFGTTTSDICIFGVVGSAGQLVQYRLTASNGTTENPGTSFRGLARSYRRYREAATANVKSGPTGQRLFERSQFYWDTPTWTEDNVNRSTFLSNAVAINSVPAMTATAKVKFGYDASFHCTANYADGCLATEASVNLTVPFHWNSENPAGLACTSSCTITVPAIANKMMYWQVNYYDAGGSLISSDAVNVAAFGSVNGTSAGGGVVSGNVVIQGSTLIH